MSKSSNNDINTGAAIAIIVIETGKLCYCTGSWLANREQRWHAGAGCLIRVGGDTHLLYCRGAALLLCCEIKTNNTTRRREQDSPAAELCFQARCVDVWRLNRGHKINMEIENQA